MKICKSCITWETCDIVSEESKFKPCTNKSAFLNKPISMSDTQSVLNGDCNSVLLTSSKFEPRSKQNENNFTLVGENFGCIHHEHINKPIK